MVLPRVLCFGWSAGCGCLALPARLLAREAQSLRRVAARGGGEGVAVDLCASAVGKFCVSSRKRNVARLCLPNFGGLVLGLDSTGYRCIEADFSMYAFCSILQALHDLHTSAPLQTKTVNTLLSHF